MGAGVTSGRGLLRVFQPKGGRPRASRTLSSGTPRLSSGMGQMSFGSCCDIGMEGGGGLREDVVGGLTSEEALEEEGGEGV